MLAKKFMRCGCWTLRWQASSYKGSAVVAGLVNDHKSCRSQLAGEEVYAVWLMDPSLASQLLQGFVWATGLVNDHKSCRSQPAGDEVDAVWLMASSLASQLLQSPQLQAERDFSRAYNSVNSN